MILGGVAGEGLAHQTSVHHARCMTTWSAPSATQHACTLLQHWVVRRWARVQLCVHLHQFHSNAHQPHPALVSPVHCHSALHSAPLAECRQQHTPPAHSPATRTAAHQTTHTPHHTRVQRTVLLLLTSHHSRPLTALVQTVHLLLQPLQTKRLTTAPPWTQSSFRGFSNCEWELSGEVREEGRVVCVCM